jgi:hypothetical protein
VTPNGLGYLVLGQVVRSEPAATAIITYDASKCVANSTTPIYEVEIWSPELKMAGHIGVGSTVAQLIAAYRSELTVDRADNSDVYILAGTGSKLLVEVAKDASGMPSEQIGTFVWMRIDPIDDTSLHIANTDAAGPCSA